ncbi:MAG: dimethylsulfoniopropionate demethylase [Alphaproteobacteria bacterium]|nr:dimethylsulfoniopropionate demethylase [Alphaproteobacteria bacterium]
MPVSLATSRRTRRSFYTARVEALGVSAYTVYNHMLLPVCFRSLEEDYRHLVSHVQLWDVGGERQVELRGTDAARLAQLMTPRDLSSAAIGQCLYAPLVDAGGFMVNDPVVLRLAADRFWLSIADSDVLLWAKGLAYGLGLDLAVSEPDICPLAVQGPKADDVMAAVFGDAVRAIRFFRFETLRFRGHPLIVARSGWSKQGGFETYADDPAVGLELWDALWEAGQPFGIGPGCPNLIERIEGALLSYGNDILHGDNPFECGLDRFCHLDRPIAFMARAALETAAAQGITRRIRGLRIGGPATPPAAEPWPVHGQGRRVGEVRSAVWSPRLATNIAIAMIGRDFWPAGSRVEVETPGGARPAIVADLPFV